MDDKKEWKQSLISLVATSPHFSWLDGFDKIGSNTVFDNNSRCLNEVFPPNSEVMIDVDKFCFVIRSPIFTTRRHFDLDSLVGIVFVSFKFSGIRIHLVFTSS